MKFEDAVAGAVRAELARFNKKPNDLCDVLAMSRPTLVGRLAGVHPFTTRDVDAIARFLGITPHDLMLSAALTDRFGSDPSQEIDPLEPPARDAWAQPARARARRSR